MTMFEQLKAQQHLFGILLTLGVPGLISFMAYLYTHRGAKGVKKHTKKIYR